MISLYATKTKNNISNKLVKHYICAENKHMYMNVKDEIISIDNKNINFDHLKQFATIETYNYANCTINDCSDASYELFTNIVKNNFNNIIYCNPYYKNINNVQIIINIVNKLLACLFIYNDNNNIQIIEINDNMNLDDIVLINKTVIIVLNCNKFIDEFINSHSFNHHFLILVNKDDINLNFV